MSIYAVKTTASQERTVADMIATREEDDIHAVLSPDSLTSY
ncbi:MAG: Early transcription elongation factor of RNA pol II, NGN section, partial [Haloquadratum sp. J07HQX50]